MQNTSDSKYRIDVLTLLPADTTPSETYGPAFAEIQRLISTFHDIPEEARSSAFYQSCIPAPPEWPETIAILGKASWTQQSRHSNALFAICLHERPPVGVIDLIRTRLARPCYFFMWKAGSDGDYYLPIDSNGKYIDI